MKENYLHNKIREIIDTNEKQEEKINELKRIIDKNTIETINRLNELEKIYKDILEGVENKRINIITNFSDKNLSSLSDKIEKKLAPKLSRAIHLMNKKQQICLDRSSKEIGINARNLVEEGTSYHQTHMVEQLNLVLKNNNLKGKIIPIAWKKIRVDSK